jgi:hypothetical protein
MTIAAARKQENIIEYLLYVWQMQDLVRAADFEMAPIRAFLAQSDQNEINVDEELEWFADLMRKMKSSGTTRKGHLPEIEELLVELNYLHHTLTELIKDDVYIKAHQKAQPNIEAFLKKAENQHMNPIEAAVTAMYGLLVLRLKGKEVSEETMGAMKTFQQFLALLADRYKKMRSGNLNVSMN